MGEGGGAHCGYGYPGPFRRQFLQDNVVHLLGSFPFLERQQLQPLWVAWIWDFMLWWWVLGKDVPWFLVRFCSQPGSLPLTLSCTLGPTCKGPWHSLKMPVRSRLTSLSSLFTLSCAQGMVLHVLVTPERGGLGGLFSSLWADEGQPWALLSPRGTSYPLPSLRVPSRLPEDDSK